MDSLVTRLRAGASTSTDVSAHMRKYQELCDEAAREIERLSGGGGEGCINLNAAERQSGFDRVRWAEGLIAQLPPDHEGRNSWLLNYGAWPEAEQRRAARNIGWDATTKSAQLAAAPPAPARDRESTE